MRTTNKGNTVGSRPPRWIDPVTTDLNPSGESDIVTYTVSNRSKSTSAMIRRPQNEREFLAYVSGYVDGEGCFTVSISRRSKMKSGWELRPSFSVSQNHDRASLLYMMMEYFDCGTIRPDRSDQTLKYEVRSLNDLVRHIIPHFEEYPLLSEKQEAFRRFRRLVLEMKLGNHLLLDLLPDMLLRATQINGGLRRYRFGKI